LHVPGRDWKTAPLPTEQVREPEAPAYVSQRGDSDDDDAPGGPTLAWRSAFMRDVPTWTAQELQEQTGHTAKNKAALASRGSNEGKIFAVKWGGKFRYPQFQFRHGEPRALIAKILRALGDGSGAWDQAFFFAAPNAYLGGNKPMERLDDKQMELELV